MITSGKQGPCDKDNPVKTGQATDRISVSTDRIPVAYGYWKSAITAKTMGARTPLYDVQWNGDGTGLVWLEQRSDTGVLVCRNGTDAPYDLTDGHPVRGGVGYGGGDFTTADDFVVFAEKDGRLYRQSLAPGTARPITPAFGAAASPTVSPDGKWVLYVHTCESVDVLALVDGKGSGWPVNLVRGADFYMQPAWHPDGERIAWIEWDQPQMPWDGTRLKTARIDSARRALEGERLIAGDTDTPVFQPAFSPDGRWLSYIVTEGEWENLIVLDADTGERRVVAEGATLADPAWVQGVRVYGWGPDGDTLYYRSNEKGFASLWKVSVSSGRKTRLETPRYTWMMQLAVSPARDAVACIASSSTVPERVVTLEESAHAVHRHTVHRRSQSEMIPEADLSVPESITWKNPGGGEVHGLYYPPASSRFSGSGKPPAIVSIHGGPTGQHRADYSAEIPFFTNRGYACLYVNYRGSTGYGRSYMTALREHWGEYDTEDAVCGAQALIEQELADPDRIVIKGGSAGGFTVLNALVHHPGVFRAGLCLYGVTNLFGLATDTHKFEAKYLDLMVGTLPEHSDRYQAWSPLFHADRIRDPVAIFQGSEDKVVPPDQAESIVEVLERNKVPHIYRLYEGEGHGWRKVETIVSFYDDVERFLKRYVL